jgi:PAS domain S-box-containing protein
MKYAEHVKGCKCNNDIFPLNSRKVLNILGDLGTDGWWDWHIKEDFEYMSPRFWQLLGYDPASKEHHPSEWQKIINGDDLKVALNNFSLHVSTKGEHPFKQIVRYTCSDGSVRWVVCSGNVIEWGEDGSPVRMIGTHTDVTEAKRNETELKEKTEMFQEIFDTALIGMAILSKEGKLIEVNDKFLSMLKYRGKEVEGRMDSEFVHSEDIEKCGVLMGRVASGEIKTFNIEKRYLDREGVVVYTKFNLTRKMKGDSIDFLIAEIVDITDKKVVQNRLNQTLSELQEFINKKK